MGISRINTPDPSFKKSEFQLPPANAVAPRLGAFTEGPYSREAKLYWQAGDPDPRPPPKLGLGSWAVSQRRAAGPAPGVSRARPATAAAASLAPNVLIKDWQYYKFQPGPAADAPRRADGEPCRSFNPHRSNMDHGGHLGRWPGTHRVHPDRMHFVLPERATSEAELPPTLWTGMPSMLLEPGYPSAAAAVKKRVADEEAAARAKLSSQCGARAQTRERFLARKGVREALEDEIASWATDALQSTASKPARRSSLMSLDGIPAHLTADEVRGSTAPVTGASCAGLGATTAPPWSSQSRSVRKQSRACAGH